MTALNAFCNQLIAFFEDLSETYPEEKDIATAAQALKLVKQANPRLMYNVFMKNIYTEFSRHILEEDDEYIIGRAKDILSAKHSHIKYAFLIFDKHWSTMSETNKQYVWKYTKSLVLLAERVS
jgi:hypothetical protein